MNQLTKISIGLLGPASIILMSSLTALEAMEWWFGWSTGGKLLFCVMSIVSFILCYTIIPLFFFKEVEEDPK
jgi:hypothetical protein